MIRKLLVLFTLMTVTAGCNTVQLPKLDPSRPVEVDHSFFGEPIKQNGKTLDGEDLVSQLAKNEASAPEIKHFVPVALTSTIFSVGGGYLIGSSLFTANSETRGQNLAIGAGSVVVGLLIGGYGHSKLANAGDAFNRRFKAAVLPVLGGGTALLQTSF